MLVVVLACFLGACLLALFAPSILAVSTWQLMHPRAALALWFGSFFLGAALALTGLVLSIVGTLMSHHPDHVAEGVTLSIFAWLGLALLGVSVALVAAASRRFSLRRASAVEALDEHATGREEHETFTLVWVRAVALVAYAAPGPRPAIFVSSGLVEQLTPAQVQAVLTHEYSHLQQRHAWATRVAELHAMCLPWVRGSHTLRRATTLLVELAADDAAARTAGPAHLANALSELARARGDEAMHWRARRLATKRWPYRSRRAVPSDVRTAVAHFNS